MLETLGTDFSVASLIDLRISSLSKLLLNRIILWFQFAFGRINYVEWRSSRSLSIRSKPHNCPASLFLFSDN